MKSLQIVACSVLLSAVSAVHAAAPPELQELLTEGQTAYMRGDLDKAKAAFEMVYRIDSRNTVAIGYLKRIKIDEETKPKGNDIEKQLSSLVVPQIQFKEATLGSALDYLKKTVDRLTNGKRAVNFVVQLSAEQVSTQTVTLNLTNVPFTEALRYLGTVADLNFTYDKYAIIVMPKTAPTASTAPTTPPTTVPLPGQ